MAKEDATPRRGTRAVSKLPELRRARCAACAWGRLLGGAGGGGRTGGRAVGPAGCVSLTCERIAAAGCCHRLDMRSTLTGALQPAAVA